MAMSTHKTVTPCLQWGSPTLFTTVVYNNTTTQWWHAAVLTPETFLSEFFFGLSLHRLPVIKPSRPLYMVRKKWGHVQRCERPHAFLPTPATTEGMFVQTHDPVLNHKAIEREES